MSEHRAGNLVMLEDEEDADIDHSSSNGSNGSNKDES